VASQTEIVERYIEAMSDHDLETAGSLWARDGVDGFGGRPTAVPA
jgi:hypothetical protein